MFVVELLLNLGGDAGSDTVSRDLVNKRVILSDGLLVDILFLSLGGLDRSGLGHGADGEGDLVLLLVDGGDLGLDLVADGQHVLGLADAAIGNLGDVDQAVNTGQDLGKSTEGHELDDLDRGDIADLVAAGELGPGVAVGILVAEGDLALFLVEADDVDIDLVADGDDLGGLVDASISSPTETTSEGWWMRPQLSSETWTMPSMPPMSTKAP